MLHWGAMDAARSQAFLERHGLRVGLTLSVLLHAVLVLLVASLDVRPPARPAAVPLRLVEKPRGREGAREAEKMSGQVVDIAPPEREQVPPDDARFLSRYNMRVEREQRARVSSRKPGAAGESRRTTPSAGARVATRTPERVASPARERGSEATGRLEGREALLRRDPLLSGPGSGVRGPLGLSVGAGLGFAGTEGGEGGGGGSDDAFLGVDREGDTTLVNSRSFKYWDFFQRVKERVRQEWDPGTVYRARDPTGTAYGARDRLTVLGVVLDVEGRVQRIEVVRESGLPFLDDEAIRAFREAAPFLNPPAGLADEKGRIAFHFGFILDLTSSRSRFFWQRP